MVNVVLLKSNHSEVPRRTDVAEAGVYGARIARAGLTGGAVQRGSTAQAGRTLRAVHHAREVW